MKISNIIRIVNILFLVIGFINHNPFWVMLACMFLGLILATLLDIEDRLQDLFTQNMVHFLASKGADKDGD